MGSKQERYPGYVVHQIKMEVDALGGYSLEVRNKIKELFGEKRARECLMKMQKSIVSSTLNIARCFKSDVQNCKFNNERQKLARFARALFIFVHFTAVLVLSST